MNHKDLELWKRAHRLSYDVAVELSRCTNPDFINQTNQSSSAILCNIEAGFNKDSASEKRRFLAYAREALAEFKIQIYVAQRLGYINNEKAASWRMELHKIRIRLTALIKATENQ